MNLVITNVCNRRCEYCFQKEWFLANSSSEIQELDLDSATKILDWFTNSHFSLIGGEPLLYSKLDELLYLVKSKNKTVTMISNISIDTDRFTHILGKFSGNTITSWLVNTDYPDYQEVVFVRNFKQLLKTKDRISLSTTLLPNAEKNKQALQRLRKLVFITRECSTRTNIHIRVSPSEPNHKDGYSKYDYTLDIYDIYLSLRRIMPTISIGLDCPVTACELNYETYATKDAQISFSGTPCYGNPPFDIMPDRSAIWCASSNFLKVADVLEFPDVDSCIDALNKQYNEYWNHNKLLCDYTNCSEYGRCKGLCPAKNELLKTYINS